MPLTAARIPSGIRQAASGAESLETAMSELALALGPGPFQHLVVFVSPRHDVDLVRRILTACYPGTTLSGCTTAGEISPAGMMDGGIAILAFPIHGFRVFADVIEDIDHLAVERANAIVRALQARMRAHANPDSGTPVPDPAAGTASGSRDGHGAPREHVFALMLIDGLSSCEEHLVAAVYWALDDVPLIGGSAGDGLDFENTKLFTEARVYERAALIVIVKTDVPFQVFKTEAFSPRQQKFVVTKANIDRRTVIELNAEPAAREYANAIGLLPDELGPFSFASYPLVVRLGGDYYCRSIRNMNEDGSLTFFCAIDVGLVLTVAEPQDPARSTALRLAKIDEEVGGIDQVLAFDCILRRLDAENRQVRREFDALYKRYRVTGFHTYGEQFKAMHLNQTLTGIAFGYRRPPGQSRSTPGERLP